jgi:NtrC-family two-component system sensor histidine kinase KinB
MQLKWTASTSLFVRVSRLFGLLVAVPLAVSGLVLTLVGRNSVLAAGLAMSSLGEEAVLRTRDRLVRAVQENLNEVTEQVSRAAQKSLEDASKDHIATSENAVGEATNQIILRGKDVFKRAGEKSALVGEKAVQDAAGKLRDVHRDSLQVLTREFVHRTDAELTQASDPVRRRLEQSVVSYSYGVNEEKVEALVLAAQRGLDGVTNDLWIAARTYDVQNFAENPVPLQALMKVNPRALSPEQVVLVSPLGNEIVRVPDTEAAPGDANPPNWAKTPEWKSAQEQDTTVFPLRPGRKGVPVLRVVQRVQPEILDQRGYGALVADVPLNNVAEMASRQEKGPAAMLLVTSEGKILASLTPAEMGSSVPALREALKQPRGSVLAPFRFAFNSPNGTTNLAVAREWNLKFPAGEISLFGVVTQPKTEVLKPVGDLEQNVASAWKSALQKVGGSSRGIIESRMEAVRDKQRQIAREARTRINQNIRSAGESVPAALKRSRDDILRKSSEEISSQARAAADRTVAGIAATRQAVARAARTHLNRAAQSGAEESVNEMRVATATEANTGAKRMFLNSAWLILMFLALALCLATITTRSLVRPINQLVRGTQALAAGDYSQRIRVEGEDELGRLALAFNDMAVAIEGGQAELRRSHETLIAQKRRMQTIVDSSPDGLVLLEPDGTVSFMNPAAQSMLVPLAREIPAAPFSIARLPEPGAERLRACLDQLQDSSSVAEMEIREPARRVLQYRGVGIVGEDGEEQGLLLHLHDITRERQIDEMKSDFISLVSHELRTPLTSILGFSSYLLTGKLGEISEPQRRALESVHRQSKRLSAIISDFLDVSRIESGRVEMRRDAVPVDGVARRVIADLQPQATEKTIRVQTHVSGRPEEVVALGDEARIAQVFTNLLGNALKFTDTEGSVDVLFARQDGEVVCQVRDTGCGIPPDELDRVFDRFYQVEKVVTRKSGGTGLGLAIVKNIVEAHGGRIWIDSTYGEGTEVTFTLPAAE